MRLNRRKLLHLGLFAIPAPVILVACGGDDARPETGSTSPSSAPAAETRATATTGNPAPAATQSSGGVPSTQVLTTTPSCADGDDPTPAQTEGPYFTPNSPERVSLREAGTRGTVLIVEGQVLTRSCQPVTRALVDFWQCDDAGVYDNTGFKLRGHQFTDASGRYRLETIVPALYPGRTRHIHVKVQAPNQRDGIFDDALVLENYRDASGGKAGAYNFVLNLA